MTFITHCDKCGKQVPNKKRKPIKIDQLSLHIPPNKMRLPFVEKKEFLDWTCGAEIYVTSKPDEENYYTFYCLTPEGDVAIYKQKGDKL